MTAPYRWLYRGDAMHVMERTLGDRETWIRLLTLPLTSTVNFQKVTLSLSLSVI